MATGRGCLVQSRPAFAAGYSLLDLLFTLAIMMVLAAVVIPNAISMVDRPRTHAAARYLASRMTRAHTQAVMRSATVALRFTPVGSDARIDEFIDGNRNGIRTVDIDSGADPAVGAPVALSDQFPGVNLEIPDVTLMSFTSYGTASSRTIYLRGRDGSRFGVRVLGASGRTRVLRYDPVSGDWVEVL